MFEGLTILGLIGAAKQIFKEATEKKQPVGSRIDWDLLDEEDKAGVPFDVRSKRMASGYYHTTEPKKMFDLMKYREDVLAGATPDELESNRLAGKYGAVKPKITAHGMNYSYGGLPSDIVVDVERYEYERRNRPDYFEWAGLIEPHEYIIIKENRLFWRHKLEDK